MTRALLRQLTFLGTRLPMAVALLLAGLSCAQAADLLPPAPPFGAPPPAPVFSTGPETSGWYLRGDVGAGYVNSPKLSISPLPSGWSGTYYNPRASGEEFVGAGVGYQFNAYLRADITGEYHGGSTVTSFASITNGCCVGLYGGLAHIASAVVLANGYIDTLSFNGITPYVGAGVGYAYNTLYGGTLTSSYFQDGSKSSFAWALMAGLGYQVTPNLKLEIGYRYLNLGSGKSGVESFAPGCYSACVGGDYINVKNLSAHEFKIGMRWLLGDMPQLQYAPLVQPQLAERPIVRRY